MIPSDHDLARLCAASELNPIGFDYIDDGAETGVWFGIVRRPDNDIVCFRGSITVDDWMRDFYAEMVSLPTVGLVHAGFAENMQLVAAKIKTLIKPNPIITGHSLGAARAAIYGGMLTADVHEDPVHIVLFGCPRPGGQQLVNCLQNIIVASYKNRHDPVTDVPLPLPDLDYTQVRDFTHIDGMVDTSLPPPFDDHHIVNYVKGIENAKSSTAA